MSRLSVIDSDAYDVLPVYANGRRALVVDDAATVRLYCSQILTKAGFGVAEAVNGLEGLELALQEPFDLLLVDINMQKMDGYAFVRAVRQQPELRDIPALMMSTESASQDVASAYAAGANFYLFKPIQPQRLVAAARLLTGVAEQ